MLNVSNPTIYSKAVRVKGGYETIAPGDSKDFDYLTHAQVRKLEEAGCKVNAAEATLTPHRHSIAPPTPQAPTQPAPPENPSRADLIRGIVAGLSEDQFTNGGKPKVDDINDKLPDGVEPVTAGERDEIFDTSKQAKN